jgi:hypothetical protein
VLAGCVSAGKCATRCGASRPLPQGFWSSRIGCSKRAGGISTSSQKARECNLSVVCWEIMPSKGEQWDWLGDPFLRVQTLLILFVLGLSGLIYQQLPLGNPLIPFRTLTDRNFLASCIIIFCAYGVFYANTISLPALLQTLFGYNATMSGWSYRQQGLCDRHAACRGRRSVSRGRRLLSDGRGSDHDGPGQLMDGTPQPEHQPLAGGLAEGGGDRRTVECCSLL